MKSGKDYARHTSLSRFLSTPEYGIDFGIVLYNGREVIVKGQVTYMPVYYAGYLAEAPIAELPASF